jgi:hypothetical protein
LPNRALPFKIAARRSPLFLSVPLEEIPPTSWIVSSSPQGSNLPTSSLVEEEPKEKKKMEGRTKNRIPTR